jgi:putative tryptophan/tyrosine transport system substrate-binding protein
MSSEERWHVTRLLCIAALCLAISAVPTSAQTNARAQRIGLLTSGACTTNNAPPLFLEGLQERGYVIGQNLLIECRQIAEVTEERFRQAAAELVRLNVDLIVAVSSAAVRGIRAASQTVPVVALDLESDPVGSGLAVNLARPGGSITGIFLDAEQMSGKRLQILREVVPRLARVAALWDATLDSKILKTTETIARSFGVGLQVLSVRGPNDLVAAFSTASRQRADAVLVMQSPFMDVNGKRIADLALQHRLPAIGIFPSFVTQGGLVSYGPDVGQLFKQVTSYIDRILKGARPGDLPIERPTHFYTALNLKTARALGVTVPSSLLAQADQVIE